MKQKVTMGAGAAAAALGVAAASYAAYAGGTWLRYGRPEQPNAEETDALLDLFMPKYDIAERHHIDVAAPAEVTFGALMDMDLHDSRVIRAIFKGRQLLLGAEPDRDTQAPSLVAMTKALGWVALAEVPGHEIVMGAVTQPWKANVEFRGIPPEQFAGFDEPDYVKIVWTLRADAASAQSSIARSETRAIATDAGARRKFRWYWSRFSPGVVLIRQISMRLVKKEAERRSRTQRINGRSTEIVVPPLAGTSM